MPPYLGRTPCRRIHFIIIFTLYSLTPLPIILRSEHQMPHATLKIGRTNADVKQQRFEEGHYSSLGSDHIPHESWFAEHWPATSTISSVSITDTSTSNSQYQYEIATILQKFLSSLAFTTGYAFPYRHSDDDSLWDDIILRSRWRMADHDAVLNTSSAEAENYRVLI
jgi:hypothetical protein